MSRKAKFTAFYIPWIHKDLIFRHKLDDIPYLDLSEEDKEICQEDNPLRVVYSTMHELRIRVISN